MNSVRLPVEGELELIRLSSSSGLEVSVLPNGCIFAMEHVEGDNRVLINQIFGSPLGGGIGRLLLRAGQGAPPVSIAGANAEVNFGAGGDRVVWEGQTWGIRHRVTLWLHSSEPVWLWRVELENVGRETSRCEATLVQDLGLGARGFVLNNEAYASQYMDHSIGEHPRFGPCILSRQNQEQFGRHPWVAHGCLDEAVSFATDALQIFGPCFRQSAADADLTEYGLPGVKLQHEAACAALQSRPVELMPGQSESLRFAGIFQPDHPVATNAADLAAMERIEHAVGVFQPAPLTASPVARSLVERAPTLASLTPDAEEIAQRYPDRTHEEWRDGELLSFFVPEGQQNRHIVLSTKERQMKRRHGAILRSGSSLLPDDATLSATCWMHGVFAAQLTLGNTALHKLFSVSRDPYNITRTSGLRILADSGDGWRLLAVPSLFEMGLSDCRWIYRLEDGEIAVHAVMSCEDPAMQWRITSKGSPARFLIFGHVAMGDHEFGDAGRIDFDEAGKRISFRPAPGGLWGRTYPQTVHHLVTSTPDRVEAIGNGALLFEAKAPRGADSYIALRSKPTDELSIALVGSLDDEAYAEGLATKFAGGVDLAATRQASRAFWDGIIGNPPIRRETEWSTILPWFVHNALIHLSVPRGLEQYTAAAWGTRDVCQGPVELLLPLGHHEPVRQILRILFAQQWASTGDWPQWFMLPPYNAIRDRHSHGDVIVWPLKALCDYIEAAGDVGFLDEPIAWADDDGQPTEGKDSVSVHIDRLLNTVRERFIPGTHLCRYGFGDWNDTLQPADPAMRDWMVSSWTVALLYQQVRRYAGILRLAGKVEAADELDELAAAMSKDFHHHLMPEGTVAGYALFDDSGYATEWLLHPRDCRTGIRHSLIPMTRSIIAGLFTADEAEHHLRLIHEHLRFPDGVRLMEKPVPYHGGVEVNFRRAESATFFGREIGLMYSHAHLRYCEALSVFGDNEAPTQPHYRRIPRSG